MSQNLWQRLFTHQPKKQAVLILGSGRSGTSVMTKCLNLMGVSLGTDHLLAPSKRINPKGYFENKDVIKIHKSLGGKVRYRPAYPGYYDSPKIKTDRAALTTYLQNFFENETYLAIKDPRMNDYIQLWQHVLADIDVAPAEVILLRNPMDVVYSNARAWHRDETLALRQWQVRTLLSLKDTQPQSRVLVTYEDLFTDPMATLKRIATKFDLPWPDDEGLLQAQIEDFIDPTLQHSDSGESLASFEARTDVDDDVKALYKLGRQAAADEAFFASTDFQQQIDGLLQDYLDRYGALYRDFNAKIDSKTFFVLGQHQRDVDMMNDLLTAAHVKMVGPANPSHAVAATLSQQLTSGTLAVATYPKDYQVVEQKEVLNNYLRKRAKHDALGGVGDAANTQIVEMLAAVSAEIGAGTHYVVLVDDLMGLSDPTEQRQTIQQLVRTLHTVQGQPTLIVQTSELTQPATQERLATFIEAGVAVPAAADAPTAPLSAPVDWDKTAQQLQALCAEAQTSPAALAELNAFINLNEDAILTTKGDQYANSLRN